MRNVFMIILSSMLFIMMIGCSTKMSPDASTFEVGNDELLNININQPFQINGYIKNKSNQNWKITHDASIFTYEIYDADGNLIKPQSNLLFRDDIGLLAEINPRSEYRNNGEGYRSKEYYEYMIDKPGKYKIKTSAKFQIRHVEASEEFNLSSSLYEFVVK